MITFSFVFITLKPCSLFFLICNMEESTPNR
ncbi:hypothetical protein GLYMA_19G115851v4 [Glycine max]|nr:hypothetical protein GLYMA_19G115851v4 [Glycine max]